MWFKEKTTDGIYYSPFKGSRTIYHKLCEGRNPTHDEMTNFLNAHPESDVTGAGLLVASYEVEIDPSSTVELPNDVYQYIKPDISTQLPERLIRLPLRDELYVENDMLGALENDISKFLASEQVYRNIQTIYKMGVLLYGPPGEGKTAYIRKVLKDNLKDAIVVFCDSLPSNQFLAHLNEIKDKFKVFVFEEFVSTVENTRSIDRILTFLDGEFSVDKSLVLATTNYPQELPGNLVDRPSRFDKMYKIGNPNKKTCLALMTHFLSRTPTDEELLAIKDMSTAYIKEICLQHLINKEGIAEIAAKMKERSKLVEKQFSEHRKIGFDRESLMDRFGHWD